MSSPDVCQKITPGPVSILPRGWKPGFCSWAVITGKSWSLSRPGLLLGNLEEMDRVHPTRAFPVPRFSFVHLKQNKMHREKRERTTKEI